MWIALGVVVALVAGLIAYDLIQRRHAILRNFPIIGHFRYLLEMVGPELRQYIVTGNDDERPFSRDRRRWIYASAKRQDNRFGFGSDNDMDGVPDYLIIRHVAFPAPPPADGAPGSAPGHAVPGGKVWGAARGRRHAFRPPSIVNVSGMSFGALSGRAIEGMNRGCAIAGALHTTGEGGIAPAHLHGGELIFQVGTGYFGCRDQAGRFDLDRLAETVAAHPVRAIEFKLSQGAKPGRGGMLPAAKVTPEIAAARGVPAGVDCVSPPYHSAFSDVDTMLEVLEAVAERTGLPVGIKSAVGEDGFWWDLATRMAATGRGVDFVTVDGGEGGTGAAPLVFADHVAFPFKMAMARVYTAFATHGLAEDVAFAGAGKLGFPEKALFAFGLGCDTVNVGREAMMAVGCIQAQRCHTGRCPTGVATQKKRLTRGLDPGTKGERMADYLVVLRREILQLSRACGAPHPALVPAGRLELLDGRFGARTVAEAFEYAPGWAEPSPGRAAAIAALMAGEPAPAAAPA
ncbi:MAG: FMN-binding glutamate synthase family protein [Solirubrobacteraceae bacterium]